VGNRKATNSHERAVRPLAWIRRTPGLPKGLGRAPPEAAQYPPRSRLTWCLVSSRGQTHGPWIEDGATRQWAKLTPAIRKRIDNKLVHYAKTGAGDVKSLSGREGARLRVGDWCVIFTEDPTTIIVAAVGHHGEIYED
jgi:mRNA interferase RelE/StbE